jgi:hypothetical protein
MAVYSLFVLLLPVFHHCQKYNVKKHRIMRSRYSDWLGAGPPVFDSLRGQDFSLHSVQTGFGAHPASCPVVTGGFLTGGNAAGS